MNARDSLLCAAERKRRIWLAASAGAKSSLPGGSPDPLQTSAKKAVLRCVFLRRASMPPGENKSIVGDPVRQNPGFCVQITLSF